jgi:hypothetical protein
MLRLNRLSLAVERFEDLEILELGDVVVDRIQRVQQ